MKKKEKKSSKHFLYRVVRWIIIWVILPVVLLYGVVAIWHPEDTTFQKVFERVENETGIHIDYSDLRLTMLGEIELNDLIVEQADRRTYSVSGQQVTLQPQRLFSSDKLLVSIAFKPLLSARAGLNFDAEAYNGHINGSLAVPIFRPEDPMHIQGEWENILFSELKKDFRKIRIDEGIISGEADIYMQPGNMKGTANISVSRLKYLPPQNVADISSVNAISRVSGELKFDGKKVTIERMLATTDSGSIRITGTIIQAAIADNSILNLDVKLYSHEPDESPKEDQYIPIKITGTAANPMLKIPGLPPIGGDLPGF